MSIPTVTLNDGNKIPVIAFGTGTALYNKDAKDLVLEALETGYVSIDTAQVYGNTASVGNALKEWKGKREDLYILSKWGKATSPGPNDARVVLEGLLKELGTDYVDMYLIHSPLVSDGKNPEAWKVLEQIKRDGLAKSIGVSNFREEDIAELAKTWEIPPAVNQIEYNPYIWHEDKVIRLTKLQNAHGIKYQTYGPLGSLFRATGGPVDEVVKDIAKSKGLTEAQVLLQWAAQHGGGTVVTTSRNKTRQKEQLETFINASPLTAEQVDAIATAGQGKVHRQFMGDVWSAAKP